MEFIERGRIEHGQPVLSHPLGLPDGTDVVVRIEPVATPQLVVSTEEEFSSLPFFGMWADREDMADAAAWVRRERERWQERVARQA
jgi:hypothetical protein